MKKTIWDFAEDQNDRTGSAKIGCHGNWRRYKNNPILKDDWGETFDVTVIQVGEKLRMYLSWRSTNSIAFVEGVDGVHWSEPVIVLSPDFYHRMGR